MEQKYQISSSDLDEYFSLVSNLNSNVGSFSESCKNRTEKIGKHMKTMSSYFVSLNEIVKGLKEALPNNQLVVDLFKTLEQMAEEKIKASTLNKEIIATLKILEEDRIKNFQKLEEIKKKWEQENIVDDYNDNEFAVAKLKVENENLNKQIQSLNSKFETFENEKNLKQEELTSKIRELGSMKISLEQSDANLRNYLDELKIIMDDIKSCLEVNRQFGILIKAEEVDIFKESTFASNQNVDLKEETEDLINKIKNNTGISKFEEINNQIVTVEIVKNDLKSKLKDILNNLKLNCETLFTQVVKTIEDLKKKILDLTKENSSLKNLMSITGGKNTLFTPNGYKIVLDVDYNNQINAKLNEKDKSKSKKSKEKKETGITFKWVLLCKKNGGNSFNDYTWVEKSNIDLKQFNYEENSYFKDVQLANEGMKEMCYDSYKKYEVKAEENMELKEKINESSKLLDEKIKEICVLKEENSRLIETSRIKETNNSISIENSQITSLNDNILKKEQEIKLLKENVQMLKNKLISIQSMNKFSMIWNDNDSRILDRFEDIKSVVKGFENSKIGVSSCFADTSQFGQSNEKNKKENEKVTIQTIKENVNCLLLDPNINEKKKDTLMTISYLLEQTNVF